MRLDKPYKDDVGAFVQENTLMRVNLKETMIHASGYSLDRFLDSDLRIWPDVIKYHPISQNFAQVVHFERSLEHDPSLARRRRRHVDTATGPLP